MKRLPVLGKIIFILLAPTTGIVGAIGADYRTGTVAVTAFLATGLCIVSMGYLTVKYAPVQNDS